MKYIWNKIEDHLIRNIWTCPSCSEESTIYPNDYKVIGTPMCPFCDDEMEYSYTIYGVEDLT